MASWIVSLLLLSQAIALPHKAGTLRGNHLSRRDETYAVQSGDTGDGIASHFGINFSDLEADNPYVNWNDLEIGSTLEVPVSGLATTYAVAAGDTGDSIASNFGVSFDALNADNPGVDWINLQIGQILQIPACQPTKSAPATTTTAEPTSQPSSPPPSTTSDQPTTTTASSGSATDTNTAAVTNSNAVTSVNDSDGIGAGTDTYNFYQGDGSTNDGWPATISWVSFADMWAANSANMGCPSGVTQNSPDEIQAIHDAIEQVAQVSAVDHRFILAIVMQESSGCVRIQTTVSPDGTVTNPGLMQDHDGTGTCNSGGTQTTPCPDAEIVQMIEDGTQGTSQGDGLVQLINQQTIVGAEAFYRAARLYNSGSIPSDGDLGGSPGATLCYASDIANRLSGWITAARTCTLDG